MEILKREPVYVSGESISKELNISRTAVWKHINKLKKEGYNISSFTNKGYRLINGDDMLTPEAIGYDKCVYFDEVISTNDEAKRLAENGCDSGTMVTCCLQNGGRGRLGRQWKADNKSVCTSIVLRPDITPVYAPMITLIAGLATAKAINEVCNINAGIKWPNDVVAEGRKLVGILTEMSAEMEKIKYVVVGIGINVNNEVFADEIKDKASSLYILTGKKQSRRDIAAALIKQLMELYNLYIDKGFAAISDEYNRLCLNRGKYVKTVGSLEISGLCKGVDDEGRLIIETADGKIEKVFTGEVSLRLSDNSYI